MLEMTQTEIDEFLISSRIGRLCMADADGKPYAIPLPFCWYGGALYLRLPMKGRKGQILEVNNQVCFEVDTFTDTLDDYASVLIEGRLEPVMDLAEKSRAKIANDAKYALLRRGFRPGHGRRTPLADLPLRKITPVLVAGRKREPIGIESFCHSETGSDQ